MVGLPELTPASSSFSFIHQDEEDVCRVSTNWSLLRWFPDPHLLLSGFLVLHEEGSPRAPSPPPPMPLTGTHLNLTGLGVLIPGLARNPRASFRGRGGGSLAMVGPSLLSTTLGGHSLQVRRFLPGSILPEWLGLPDFPHRLLPGIGIWDQTPQGLAFLPRPLTLGMTSFQVKKKLWR